MKLHSPYDPVKEAERFIKQRITSPPTTIILLGPALNYLSMLLKRFYPEAAVISVYYHKDFFMLDGGRCGLSLQYTDDHRLFDFLRTQIGEFDLEGLAVIEWPPSARIFPEISERVNRVIKDYIDQLYAGFLTAEYFGKRWIKNSIKNFLFQKTVITDFSIHSPVLLAASGPSLEDSLTFIQNHKDSLFIAALPSAVNFLYTHNIHIDLVVTTDAGFYSSYHNAHIALLEDKTPLLAKSVTSRFDMNNSRMPVFFFGSNDGYEALFLSNMFENPGYIPANGTVAGSAFDLILEKKPPFIIFAGLDFSYRDILSHARPHPFYSEFLSSTCKLNPFSTVLYSRFTAFESTSKAFSTFASWFNYRSANVKVPVYRLNPSNIPINGMIPITETNNDNIFSHPYCPDGSCNRRETVMPKSEREKKIVSFLTALEKHLQIYLNKNDFFSFDELRNNRVPFSVFHFMYPLRLKKIKKLYRFGEKETANKVLHEISEDTLQFLKTLLEWCA